MAKPLLVTNIDDLLIKHRAFTEPHRDWFKRAIKKTGDKSLKKWVGKKEYFPGVMQAMAQIMPKASSKKQIAQARKWYQADVVSYIKSNPSCILKTRAKKLEKLKSKYKLVLVTTMSKSYVGAILKVAKLSRLYDGIIASKTEEEPRKADLITQLIKKYGKPDYYVSGKKDAEVIAKFKKTGARILSPSKLESL